MKAAIALRVVIGAGAALVVFTAGAMFSEYRRISQTPPVVVEPKPEPPAPKIATPTPAPPAPKVQPPNPDDDDDTPFDELSEAEQQHLAKADVTSAARINCKRLCLQMLDGLNPKIVDTAWRWNNPETDGTNQPLTVRVRVRYVYATSASGYIVRSGVFLCDINGNVKDCLVGPYP